MKQKCQSQTSATLIDANDVKKNSLGKDLADSVTSGQSNYPEALSRVQEEAPADENEFHAYLRVSIRSLKANCTERELQDRLDLYLSNSNRDAAEAGD